MLFMNQIESRHTADSPKLNGRVWQAWVYKNRELDKTRAARRMRTLQVVLGIVILAAMVRHFMT